MAIQDALLFFQLVRRDEGLRREVEELGWDATLDDLATLAKSVGFRLTPEDLHQGHLHDWRMRWARYRGEGTSARDPAQS